MQSEQLRVAFLGPQGTYTHQAAAGKFKDAQVEFIPFETITRTFEAVCQNAVDYACVPLENSLHGSVIETLDLLRADRPSEQDVTIAGEFTMGIEHCLIVCQGVKLKDIQRVLSHEQALGQCQDFLSKNLPGAIKVPTASTAYAAEQILQLSKSGDPLAHHSAAICSRICVELHHGLQVLRSGIQDGETNFTRFVIASKRPVPSQVQPDTLQRALVRCVLPVDNDSNPRTTLSSIIRLLPEGIEVARVDRRPSLSKTPFHDCVFLELVSNPPLVPDSPNCDVNHVWGIKVSLTAITINKAVGGDTPCCRVLGAW